MLTHRLNSIPRFALPYTTDDFMSAVDALRNGAPSPDSFTLLGESRKFWTGSGRQALRLLLASLDLPPQSGVAVPLFTDPSLASAIAAAGHRPVFIDVHPDTLTMDPGSLDAARGEYSALVIVHLFGQLADVPGLLAVAGDVPVIEDAAHAPLSFLIGRMAGEFGLASFYSFASTKYWPAGGGGLAVVHDPELGVRMERAVRTLTPPSRSLEIRNLILQAAKSMVFSRRAYGLLGRPMRRWADAWALLEPSLDMSAIQRTQAAAARRQASRFPARVEQQRANSLRLLGHLSHLDDVVLPRERPGARYNYHLFPVLLRDRRERDAVRAAMWKQFVDTSTIYSHAIDSCTRFGYTGGCPVSESVATRLLTLPNHAALGNSEIDLVAEVFLSSLQACRTVRHAYPALGFGQRVPIQK
jgi:dTDP-4-amino-4,6-dideoxygalactose transaminase